MNYFTCMLGLDESDSFVDQDDDQESEKFPEDLSGFSEEECFGCDKTELPSREGMDASEDALDDFVDATDGRNRDIKLSLHDSFPKDNSGFEKDANSEIDNEEEFVDAATVPSYHEEDDQFDFDDNDSDEEDNIEDYSYEDDDLADDDSIAADESATEWDDLF